MDITGLFAGLIMALFALTSLFSADVAEDEPEIDEIAEPEEEVIDPFEPVSM